MLQRPLLGPYSAFDAAKSVVAANQSKFQVYHLLKCCEHFPLDALDLEREGTIPHDKPGGGNWLPLPRGGSTPGVETRQPNGVMLLHPALV